MDQDYPKAKSSLEYLSVFIVRLIPTRAAAVWDWPSSKKVPAWPEGMLRLKE
jgi:hypothetical protein